jgi:hypothetical protein
MKEPKKELSAKNMLLFPHRLWMEPLRTKFKGFELHPKSFNPGIQMQRVEESM